MGLAERARRLVKSRKLLVIPVIILAIVFVPIPPVGSPVEELDTNSSLIVIDGVKNPLSRYRL